MICSRQFILIYFMSSFSVFSGFFAISNSKEYGQALGYTNESYLALLASMAAIFNSLRFFWSALMDCISYKAVYSIILVI
jgi:hypothetical protein